MVDLIKLPTQEIQEAYSYGRCMYLATALHRKYNLEIQCIMESDSISDYIEHVWVIDTDGMMIDIIGKRHPEKNDFVNDISKIIKNLDEKSLFSIIKKHSETTYFHWESNIEEANSILDEYFAENPKAPLHMNEIDV